MANKIQHARINSAAYVDVTSRYLGSRVLYWGENNVVTLETYKRRPPVLGKTDKFYLITAATQYRPDLVANIAYGISSFWWRIMEANAMKDISDFKSGTTIRIPESLF